MLVVDKTNQIKEVQPFESYLIPNPHSARLKYYNDVVSVWYTECFTDFSSKERFQHYLIAERRRRFEIESDINSLASKLDEIKSNSANSDSGHSYNIQRLQSIPHDTNSEDVFRCERAIGALEKMMNSSQDITNRLSEKRKNCYLPSLDLVPGGKRQAKEMCKLLTGNGERDITQKASIPVIDSDNLNREALHTKLRKRHLVLLQTFLLFVCK